MKTKRTKTELLWQVNNILHFRQGWARKYHHFAIKARLNNDPRMASHYEERRDACREVCGELAEVLRGKERISKDVILMAKLWRQRQENQ